MENIGCIIYYKGNIDFFSLKGKKEGFPVTKLVDGYFVWVADDSYSFSNEKDDIINYVKTFCDPNAVAYWVAPDLRWEGYDGLNEPIEFKREVNPLDICYQTTDTVYCDICGHQDCDGDFICDHIWYGNEYGSVTGVGMNEYTLEDYKGWLCDMFEVMGGKAAAKALKNVITDQPLDDYWIDGMEYTYGTEKEIVLWGRIVGAEKGDELKYDFADLSRLGENSDIDLLEDMGFDGAAYDALAYIQTAMDYKEDGKENSKYKDIVLGWIEEYLK